mmetsp:Transcript_5316/g.8141  ORF Transcript_5316/g.8141 Transcript_5316/m.8141 type:complete len:267 (-) Transcript_5316:100-900(-)
MNHPLQNPSFANPNDLQLMTSVDSSIQQNVPVPQQAPTLNANPLPSSQSASEGSLMSNFLKDSGHPIPAFFHIFFKAAAVCIYLLGGVVKHSTNFITVTVVCILLLAADFWVVKNITGRLLVGLRWWAQVEGEEGTETKWIFEAAPDTSTTNKFDSTWFWGVLYVTPLVWSVFFFSCLLKWNFAWMITVSFAIALSSANVYGYWQCSKDQKAKFQQMVAKGAEYGAGAAIRHNVFGRVAGFANMFGPSAGQPQGQAQGQARETTFV